MSAGHGHDVVAALLQAANKCVHDCRSSAWPLLVPLAAGEHIEGADVVGGVSEKARREQAALLLLLLRCRMQWHAYM